MGGGGRTESMTPPPVDYTAAMGMVSGNNMITALGAQGAQEFGVLEASMNRSEITAAHLELGLSRLDERRDEAHLASKNERLHEMDRHDEKMLEIKTGDGSKKDTSDFLASG